MALISATFCLLDVGLNPIYISKQYIGETNLRNRTTLHNQHIRHEALRKIPLSDLIADCSDNILCFRFTK